MVHPWGTILYLQIFFVQGATFVLQSVSLSPQECSQDAGWRLGLVIVAIRQLLLKEKAERIPSWVWSPPIQH